MGFPIVIVDTFGLPVIPSETGVSAQIATNGFGSPVILVDRGGFAMNVGGAVFMPDNAGSYLIDHLGRYLVAG